jgi:RHS repeat-associated protein
VLTITDYKAGGTQTQTFGYDNLDRLTSAVASGGTGGTYSLKNYAYNPDTGNLSSNAGVNYTYGDSAHKHAVTSTSNGNSYGYDQNGNQTTRTVGGITYTLIYDAESRLVQIKRGTDVQATYYYDGDGNRIRTEVGSTFTTYIGSHLEWECIDSTCAMKKYYSAAGQRVALRKGDGTLYFLLTDHLGSTAITATSSGGRYAELRYYPWGGTRYTYGTTPTSLRYTGQREAEVGLYYFGARFYDPQLGRFVAPDTIIPQQQGTQAFDRYAYANNSPTKYTDPSGHGAYCGDDYDPGCLSDEEMPSYYRGTRNRTVQVDLDTHDSPNQYDPAIVNDEDYGYNACGIVAGCAAGASFDEMGAAVRDHKYSPEFGIQPSDYEDALIDVYGSENVDAGEVTLSEVTEALEQGAVVIVDILIQSGGSDVAHFARVLGIDWGAGDIYIENTLGDDISYLTISFDEFEAMWLDPENRASVPAPNAELVNNWAVFIRPR